MKSLGWMLQVAGLILLPIAVLLELSGVLGRSFGLNQMLIMLIFGASAFLLGRMLEGHAT